MLPNPKYLMIEKQAFEILTKYISFHNSLSKEISIILGHSQMSLYVCTLEHICKTLQTRKQLTNHPWGRHKRIWKKDVIWLYQFQFRSFASPDIKVFPIRKDTFEGQTRKKSLRYSIILILNTFKLLRWPWIVVRRQMITSRRVAGSQRSKINSHW